VKVFSQGHKHLLIYQPKGNKSRNFLKPIHHKVPQIIKRKQNHKETKSHGSPYDFIINHKGTISHGAHVIPQLITRKQYHMVPHVIPQLITREHNHMVHMWFHNQSQENKITWCTWLPHKSMHHDQIMESYHSTYPFKQLPK
jgi:hypothetical protein